MNSVHLYSYKHRRSLCVTNLHSDLKLNCLEEPIRTRSVSEAFCDAPKAVTKLPNQFPEPPPVREQGVGNLHSHRLQRLLKQEISYDSLRVGQCR